MDTLKGFVYLETIGGKESWNLAVEDPENLNYTRIIKCKGKYKYRYTYRSTTDFSHKRGGNFKFKAFRFMGKVEKIETREYPVTSIMKSLPENLYQQIPIIELRKLEGWID